MRILKFFEFSVNPLKIEIHHFIHDDKETTKLRVELASNKTELDKLKSGVVTQVDKLNTLGETK